MTNRERVIAAIEFRNCGVPHNMFFTKQAHDNVCAYTGDEGFEAKLNQHITQVILDPPQTALGGELYRDEFGVVWDKSGVDKDIGVIRNIQIPDGEALLDFCFPPVDEGYVRGELSRLAAADPGNFRVAALGFSLFERAWTLMGMENLLCNMLIEPETVHALMERICERDMEILDIALEYPFDCFHFGDDWGQQRGLIMGKPHWESFIKPYLSRLYGRVKGAGRYLSQHSCGDLRSILPELDEMGLDIYQTFQPEIYTLDYARELSGKIAVWGGISTQVDLPFRSPEEVRRIAEETAAAFGYTGVILSPTHALEVDVPPENILALGRAFVALEEAR